MKIPNTVCKLCNSLLNIIFLVGDEHGTTPSSAVCINCNYEFPYRFCTTCENRTIHIGNNFGTCTGCILQNNFNLQAEYDKVMTLMHSIYSQCKEQKIMYELGEYLYTIESKGYHVKKCHTVINNECLSDVDKGIIDE